MIGKFSRAKGPAAWPRVALDGEDGSFTIWAMITVVAMAVTFGFAIDYMRAEAARARLQGAIDQSVLAGASKFGAVDPVTLQPRTPEEIARSYFAASGFDGDLPEMTSSGDCNDSFVQAKAQIDVRTTYLGLDIFGEGYDAFPAGAAGRATETMPRIEVSLVLDVSGSMDRNERIDNLRPAAKEFVSMMLETPCAKPNVYISVIPFATQVTAGPDLLAAFDPTDEHGYSHCVDFSGSSFNDLDIAPGAALERTSHFDPWLDSDYDPSIRVDPAYAAYDEVLKTYWVCHPDDTRSILPWSIDQTALDAFIDNMPVGGNTSMDVGAKWGLALLDPAMRPVLEDYVDAGDVDAYYSGRPLDYSGNPSDVIKVLVLMTDGENTHQYYLKSSYRAGSSGVWVDSTDPMTRQYSTYMGLYYVDKGSWTPGSGWNRSTYPANDLKRWAAGNSRGITQAQAFPVFFHHDLVNGSGGRNQWRATPDGAPSGYSFADGVHSATTPAAARIATNGVAELSWQELFATVHTRWWSEKIVYEAQVSKEVNGSSTGRWTAYNDAVKSVSPGTKDSRLHTICRKARAQGVQIFTISFEAPQAGRTALLNCANDGAQTSRYFDVEGRGIRDAFASIVEQLNLLRLVK